MTPYECLYGKRPDVSHLKVFGCDAFMHIPNELTKKWDSKTKKCIFIGYSLFRKGYRLFDPRSKKLYESRDVLFVENEFGGRIESHTNDAKETDATVQPDFKSKNEEPETKDDGRGTENR